MGLLVPTHYRSTMNTMPCINFQRKKKRGYTLITVHTLHNGILQALTADELPTTIQEAMWINHHSFGIFHRVSGHNSMLSS